MHNIINSIKPIAPVEKYLVTRIFVCLNKAEFSSDKYTIFADIEHLKNKNKFEVVIFSDTYFEYHLRPYIENTSASGYNINVDILPEDLKYYYCQPHEVIFKEAVFKRIKNQGINAAVHNSDLEKGIDDKPKEYYSIIIPCLLDYNDITQKLEFDNEQSPNVLAERIYLYGYVSRAETVKS